MKDKYLAIMQAAFEAYGEQAVGALYEKAKAEGITEQGFPRLVSDLTILICHGKNCHMKEIVSEMLLFCCRQMPLVTGAGNDFSVKELIFALQEAQNCDLFDPCLVNECKKELEKFDPYRRYDRVCASPDAEMNNWAAYNSASEFMRQKAGLCDAEIFLNLQLPSQLRRFDENGMYRDPHEPMLYDLATRVQLALLLFEGYEGAFRSEIEENLIRSEALTLQMISVNGEIPFGGRSNQFLFNEAYYAALCEFYAVYEKSRGNIEKAGQFRDAAALAAGSIIRELNTNPGTHVKNRFPADSRFGCETYAYFDKYMISLASFIYLAFLFADDSIEAVPCPARAGDYIARTSGHFHKLFVKKGPFSLEFDLKADFKYDASGLGRIHKKDIPSPLCLSCPFPGPDAKYHTDPKNTAAVSLCATTDSGDQSADEYLVEKAELDENGAIVVLRPGCGGWTETFIIDNETVEIVFESETDLPVCAHIPLMFFDGTEHSVIDRTSANHSDSADYNVNVTYRGHVCRYTSNVAIINSGELISNRNGRYLHAYACGSKVILKISFE